jgi:hypothetical protein
LPTFLSQVSYFSNLSIIPSNGRRYFSFLHIIAMALKSCTQFSKAWREMVVIYTHVLYVFTLTSLH